ncbi:MAG: hypothetical protein EXS42_02640 [Lacunisphaera sp.]|nr:hypothetical protein [Lacunisphaera sp.]
MTLRLLKSAFTLSIIALPLVRAAQTSSNEQERMEALTRADSADWHVPKSSLTIGILVLSSGAKVNFGHLGSVPFSTTVAPASDGAVSRTYDNGFVNIDAPRADELNAAGS